MINFLWQADPKHWFGGQEKSVFKRPNIRDRSRPYYLTLEQARSLIDACHLPHLRLFVQIGLCSAARKRAIEDLMWADIDFDLGTIDFGRVDHRKLRPIVYMTPELQEVLESVYKLRCSDYVIEYKGSRAGDVKKGLASAARRAGLKKATAHVLKHTFISWLAADGVAVSEISDLTNTSENTIRKHYTHLFPDNRSSVASVTRGLFVDTPNGAGETVANDDGDVELSNTSKTGRMK